jgi:hypothetical protein
MPVYPSALSRIARGTFNWERATVEALLVDDKSLYDPSHTLVSDVKGELRDGTRVKVADKSITDDNLSRIVYTASNVVFSSQAVGQLVGACVIYEPDTNALIAFVQGSVIPTDGANVTVSCSSGVFGFSYA